MCSPALGNGIAVSAAHFAEELPDISKWTFAVANVPETYLSDKPFNKRKGSEFPPKDGFYSVNETVLVRLIEF